VTLAVRPEDTILSGSRAVSQDAIAIDGAVDKVTYAGREAFYRLTGEGTFRILAHVYRPDAEPLAAVGERISVEFPLARLHAFDPADGRRIELLG
jgi:ABC-type sugar transport system ATPase subunit